MLDQKEYETHRNHLMEIRDAELDKELLAAFRKSGLSHLDAIDLIKNSRSDDGEESDES